MAKKKSASSSARIRNLQQTLDACAANSKKLLAKVVTQEKVLKDRDSTLSCLRQLVAENEAALKRLQEIDAAQTKIIEDQGLKLTTKDQEIELLKGQIGQPIRHRLDDTRRGVTHKFTVGGHEGYMNVGFFPDGTPGELFITMAKEGSTIGGLMDAIGTLTSIAFQYGVNVETLARKFSHQRFEPSGFTSNPELKEASSIIDYVFRWLELHFVKSRQVESAKA